jgi:hemoglobin
MLRVTRWRVVLSACLAAALAAGAARAAEEKKDAMARPSASDLALHASLRDVINHGANLYNQGDWNGCYRLWEGALMSVKPLLGKRANLQKAIDDGIANARQDPMLWHRAWVLRTVLDQVRSELKGKAPLGKQDENVLGEDKPTGKEKPKTLWGRLGGEKGVTQIVDDFANLAVRDPKVDFFRGGKYKPKPEEVVKMKRELVEQISQASGGPLKYKGPDMKKVHKGMGITDAQFNAAAADLKKALEKNDVHPDDVKAVLGAVEKYRKDIVEPKKPEDKKPGDKNPGDKKPEDKKPGEKKPGDKKPAATASVSGKITYKGKPVPDALIAFVGKDGFIVVTSAGADGTFTADKLRVGEYTVTIDPPMQRPGGPKPVAIPKQYSDLRTSPLKCTVKDGKQNHDINLAD